MHKIAASAFVALLFFALTAPSAVAQNEPTIVVDPHTGLATDGPTLVTVTGSNFRPFASVGIAECPITSTGALDCTGHKVEFTDGSGGFSTTFDVVPVFTSLNGVTYDCTVAPGACFLGAQVLDFTVDISDTQLLTFGPPPPPNKEACKGGGWRNYADNEGRPFRNQGQCVSFVVSHRPS